MHPGDDAFPIDDSVDENAWTEDPRDCADEVMMTDELNEAMEAAGKKFGTKSVSPYEMDVAAIAEMCDLADDNMLGDEDDFDDFDD
jgi:hypothetical protein